LREPFLRQIIATDPHAPSQFRAYEVRNFDAWYTAST
jgi:predicted metalloendopeptidase